MQIRYLRGRLTLRLFVANIAWSVTSKELRELFSRYGQVRACLIIADQETGRSRGFGFVQMDSDDEAAIAIEELNGYVLGGRNLQVNEAVDRHRSPVAAAAPRSR
jgi:RNA recognition motif-containing protein